jgi:hypothetical protein
MRATREQARADVFAFIQQNNLNRRHSSLDYLTPRKPTRAELPSRATARGKKNPMSVEPGETPTLRTGRSGTVPRLVNLRTDDPHSCLERPSSLDPETVS